jgi:hypothetical protein
MLKYQLSRTPNTNNAACPAARRIPYPASNRDAPAGLRLRHASGGGLRRRWLSSRAYFCHRICHPNSDDAVIRDGRDTRLLPEMADYRQRE